MLLNETEDVFCVPERRMELSEDQQELGHLVMEALSVLLTGNSSNAGRIRLDNPYN